VADPCTRAEHGVRQFAAALDILLHGVFGHGSLWTPTMHTLVHDIVVEFCDLHKDMWFGNEQSIESGQQTSRNLLYSLLTVRRSIRLKNGYPAL
jgi:hypothetical protein